MRRLTRARAPQGQARGSVARDPTRLEAFSDGVFAITITLLVLEIRPPADDENLLHGLGALWPSYLSYAVTFLFMDRCGRITTSCSTTSVPPTGPCCC